jgi:peptidoglycan/xylan/chitin deacetylase (PgdA/CDA1 family)
LHSWSHTDFTTLNDGQIIAEIIWTARIVKELTGVTPRIVRLPYGRENARILRLITAMGMRVVHWNFVTDDYKYSFYPTVASGFPYEFGTTPSWVTDRVKDVARNPHLRIISNQHDLYKVTAELIDPTLDVIIKAKYRVKTVSDCTDEPAYSDMILNDLGIQIPGWSPPPSPSPVLPPPRCKVLLD